MSIKTIHTFYENEPVSDRDRAEMLSFRFISEIDRLMERDDMSKKELAALLGTSASYITQLFKGDKLLNMEILARIELVFKVQFGIEARRIQARPVQSLPAEKKQKTAPRPYTPAATSKPLLAREDAPAKSKSARKK
ncbi:MAG: helix-turn-helix transcriptional regulator [Bacteroidia bacterium]|nr:helix-turn-helix transcriptional regulator [Bacteroidia bacterium]